MLFNARGTAWDRVGPRGTAWDRVGRVGPGGTGRDRVGPEQTVLEHGRAALRVECVVGSFGIVCLETHCV